MLKNLCTLLAIFIFAAPLVAQQTAAAQPNEVLVKFRATANTASVLSVASQEDISESRPVGGAGAVRLHSRSKDSATLIQHLKANPDVEYVEPNYILHTTATPDDPLFSQLWGMPAIGAPAAWDISTGSSGVVVGVVDTGIDYTHPDLAANIWSAPTAFTVNIGGTLVTCAAGAHGFNALTLTCDPMDDNEHGTHVSGTIGAVGNNGFGVVGVNWATSIMGTKFLNAIGSGAVSDAINAIEFAIQAKAAFGASANVRVLNNSYGCAGTGPSCLSQAFQDEITRAYNNNILFVAAAGNNGTNNDQSPFYPADYQNVVAVAAIDSSGNLASFSNYGPNLVPVAAPGVNILSTLPGGTYGALDGTSMATPHVVGSAALILSACGPLNTDALRSQILSNAVMTPAVAGKVHNGVLNVNNAIQACGPPSISPASVTLTASQTQTFTVTVPNGGNSAIGSWTLSPQVGTLQWIAPLGQQVRYYAPASITTPQTVKLRACLASNSSLCDTATVTLMPQVLISPSAVILHGGGSQTFTVTLPGGGNSAIGSWTLSPQVGTLQWIAPMGQQVKYYAPASVTTLQTVTLTACLASNLSQCGTATVTLVPPVVISPSSVVLDGGGSQVLTANVPIGSWELNPWGLSSVVGSLQWVPNGQQATYSAPTIIASQQTITVTACSSVDPASCGTATLTLMPVVVSVSPASATLFVNQMQSFTATVSNASNGAIGGWTLSPQVGTLRVILPNGQQATYTAPSSITTPQTVTVTACSTADPTKCGAATVTLMPQVLISPSSVILYAGGSQTFTVTLPNGGNSAIGSWTLSPQVGTLQWIAPMGQQVKYYAPSSVTSQQTVTLTACLLSNSSQCGTAAVTLLPRVSPSAATVHSGGMQGFTANVTGGATIDHWTLTPATGAGSLQVLPSGVAAIYSAPSTVTSQQTVIVTAYSGATTVWGTATVTLLP